jgi:hypothetical protein
VLESWKSLRISWLSSFFPELTPGNGWGGPACDQPENTCVSSRIA